MNKRARLNYINALSQNVEHKKMYKAKKQWVVAGISFLVATGMGAIGSHLTTHAQVNNPTTNRVASGANNTQKAPASASSKGITSQAIDLHSKILNNANPIKTSATSVSSKVSGSQVSSSNTKSSVTSNVATSGSNMNTLNLGNSSEQTKGWNYVQYGIDKPSGNFNSQVSNKTIDTSVVAPKSEVNFTSTSKVAKKNKPLMLNATSVGMIAPSDENAPKGVQQVAQGMWGSAYWNVYKNGQLDIHDGNMQTAKTPNWFNISDGSGKLEPNPGDNIMRKYTNGDHITSIKIYNTIAPVDCTGLFGGSTIVWPFNNGTQGGNAGATGHFNNLQSVDLSGLDTSNTTSMRCMFNGDVHLRNVNFGSTFNTSNVQDMSIMFGQDSDIGSLDLNSFDTSKCTNYWEMFAADPNIKVLDIRNFKISDKDNTNSMFGFSWTSSVPNQHKPYIKELVLNPHDKFADDTGIENNTGTPQLTNSNGQNASNWGSIINNPDRWIDTSNNDTQNYTVQFHDDLTNKDVSNTQYMGLKNISFLPVSDISLPKGYKLAANAGTTAQIINGNTATINVMDMQNVNKYGNWGNANWILYNGGLLKLLNGALETNQMPSDLLDSANLVSSVSTKNVDAPGDASNLFVPFNKSSDFNLQGVNFGGSSNLGDVVPDTDASVEFNATYYDTLNREQANQIASDNAKASSEATSAESAASNSAISDTYSLANEVINSDSAKVSTLSSAYNNKSYKSLAADDVKTISNAETTISGIHLANDKSNITNIIADVSNANKAYDSAYTANNSIESLALSSLASSASSALSKNGGDISALQQTPVYAYVVKPDGHGNDVPVQTNPTNQANHGVGAARNSVYLGTLGAFHLENLTHATNGYHLTLGQNLKFHKINLPQSNNKKPVLTLGDTQSDTVHVTGNPVNYSRNITFNFYTGSNSTKPIETFNISNPTSNTEVGNYINLVTGGSSNDTNILKFINDNYHFNTSNFSSDSNNPKSASYEFEIPSASNSGNNTSTVNEPATSLVFNYYAKQVPEHINYVYGSSNVNEGSTTISGYNDTQGDITSANASGMSSGWHLANSSNPFSFGNDGTGSLNISVAPNTITDTIHYNVSDNSKYSYAGSTLNSAEVIKFNDDRASAAGSLSASADTKQYMPSGYHLASGVNTTFKHTTSSNSSDVTDIITIDPNSESEKINYSYGNSSVSSSTITGGFYSNASTVTTAPAGWKITANSNFTFGLNNNTDNVQMTPSSVSETIYFIPSGESQTSENAVGNSVYHGTDYRTSTGNYSVSFSTGASSAQGLPATAGYHIDGSQSVEFGSSNAAYITVIGNSDKINRPVPFTPNASDNKKPSSNGAPSDVIITPKPTSDVKKVTPNQDGFTPADSKDRNYTFYVVINKDSNGKYVGTYAKRFTIGGKTNDTTTFKANEFTPAGYKPSSDDSVSVTIKPNGLSTQSAIFNYDAINSFNPNSPSDKNNPKASNAITVHYVNTENNDVVESDENALYGFTDATGTYTATAPKGYTIASGKPTSYNYTIPSNHGVLNIDVTPQRATAKVLYEYEGKTINKYVSGDKGSNSFIGDTNVQGANNTTFTIGSNPTGDSRFHLVHASDATKQFNYEESHGKSYVVQVVPDNATIAVSYSNQNGTIVNSGNPQLIKMSDLSRKGYPTTVGSHIDNIITLLKAPSGYHFDANEPAPIKLQMPFYSSKHTLRVGNQLMAVMPFNLKFDAENDDASTINANNKINSDSAVVNSESGSATSMMSNSNLSGVTRDSIISASNTIASASAAIHNDSGKGASAESNADSALASASTAYSGASSIASSVANSISSSASASSKASSAAAQSSMASNIISSYISSVASKAKSSAESASATSAVSNSAKQINSDISSAKNWDQNSSISDGTRKSISNDINTMNSDNSKANQFSGKGTNGSTSAQPYFNNAASAYSDASNLAKNALNSIASSEQNATNAKSSATSVSASAALSSSTSQINANISSAKNWTSNSAINDTNRSSITSDISMMNADISKANQYINQGVSGSASAAPYLASASSAYSVASSLANSAINSYNSSVSASALSSVVANAVSNATKYNKPASASSVSLTSDEEKAIANDIDVNIKPNSAVVTNTVVDHSALTSLTNEVATENQSINSLANKPAPTATVNYNNFDNLINQGIDRLENTINTDFKATIHHTAKAKITNAPITRGFKPVKKHIRWIVITKPVKLYNKHGEARTLRPSKVTLDVHSVYKVHGHFVFKVSYHHHIYFMADNHSTFKNAYLPKSDKLIGKKVRVLHDVYAYRHKASDKVRTLHRGFTTRIKNIVRLGNYNMTRIQLTNGNWISANKNFVKVL